MQRAKKRELLYDRGLIQRERPDVVIQEMVERSLMGSLPTDF